DHRSPRPPLRRCPIPSRDRARVRSDTGSDRVAM
ncbi:MAG: hypothetical protein AVDCRST_MAG87-3453, partial [uncultured Thermomicrobiales bacterium]